VLLKIALEVDIILTIMALNDLIGAILVDYKEWDGHAM
jgi:hypothetical protein